MTPQTPPPRSTDQGFSLMELIVVLMVFALIATFSLQALTGTLRTRDRLVELDETTKDIHLAVTLLRADLQAAVPLAFYGLDGQQSSSLDISPGQDQFAVSVSGRKTLPHEPLTNGFGRVIWRLDRATQTLYRQSWRVLIPADTRSLSPEVPMATGIQSMQIRTLLTQGRWIIGSDPNAGGTSTRLPHAVDIILTDSHLGAISTVVGYP